MVVSYGHLHIGKHFVWTCKNIQNVNDASNVHVDITLRFLNAHNRYKSIGKVINNMIDFKEIKQ